MDALVFSVARGTNVCADFRQMGQSKKKRPCPAVNRDISAAECGENRQSRYACLETCSFNPHTAANYDALLEIETRLDAATVEMLASDIVASSLWSADLRRQKNDHGKHATTARHLFFERDSAGLSLAARWLAHGDDGLTNDERALFRCKMQIRVALLEIHRVVDDRQFEAVDLLSEAPVAMRFVDRSVASESVRFETMLTWVYPMPHFWRVSGTGIGIDGVVPLPAREAIDECIRHLGGPAAGDPARGYWLVQNFARIGDVLHATARQRRRLMLETIDGLSGSATYEMLTPMPECQALLSAEPLIKPDSLGEDDEERGFTTSFIWLDTGGQSAVLPGERILGKILLGAKEVRVDAIGGASLDALRARVEALLGSRIRFSRERRDNWARQQLANEPVVDLTLVPARFLENPPRFEYSTSQLPEVPRGVAPSEFQARVFHEQHQRLLDEIVPALGKRTPRQAALEPAARGDLLEWTKGLVRQVDENNLKIGRTDDINWLIRELGLTELDFPAPPVRAAPKNSTPAFDHHSAEPEFDPDDFDEAFGYESEAFNANEELDEAGIEKLTGRASDWSAPPLPQKPLSPEEADERMLRAFEAFNSPVGAVGELVSSGATVLDDVREICDARLDRDDLANLAMLVANLWFALVPKGQTPGLRYEVMVEAFDQALEAFETMAPEKFMGWLLDGSPQPHLLEMLALQTLDEARNATSAMRLSPDAAMVACVIFKVLIAELDHALRR